MSSVRPMERVWSLGTSEKKNNMNEWNSGTNIQSLCPAQPTLLEVDWAEV